MDLLPPFHVMAKPAGSRCNLACRYCFYADKPRASQSCAMSLGVLEAFVEKYISQNSAAEVSFGWQGGEPLIAGLDFFKEALRLQKKHARGKRISNSLQTNATLLDDEWCEFFKSENFLLGISLDGPRELHEANRPGSYSEVLRGLRLCQKHGVEFNILCTVNSANAGKPREVYRHLRGLGARHMQFIPVVERDSSGGGFAPPPGLEKSQTPSRAKLSELSPGAEDFGDFLAGIFRLWCPKDIAKVSVTNFDDMLIKLLRGVDSFCMHAENCGRALALEQDGGAYSCDHYVYEGNLLGNVTNGDFSDMFSSRVQEEFARAKSGRLSRRCLACKYLKYCNGDCPKRRLDFYEAQDYPTSALCSGYKKFYALAVPIVEKMASLAARGVPPDKIAELL